ncbi:MAG: hypothetical protein QOC92_4494 [Acidimicrobiaceae bacterium]
MNDERSLTARLEMMTQMCSVALDCFEKALDELSTAAPWTDLTLGRKIVEDGRQVIAIHGLDPE